MHTDYPLPPLYTKFGRVIEGQEVVDAIANVRTGSNDKPSENIVMEKVTIEEQ
jgi:cyclophilin family peptidyl-prolyl cis-trans isomerase